MKLVILLLLVSYDFTTSLSIAKDNTNLRHHFRQNSEFVEWLRNWIRHSKERICERFLGITVPPPLPPKPENFDISEIESCISNREKLLVDLSALSFDPSEDWGFRIGSWYFIKKTSEDGFNNDSNEWDTTSSTLMPEDSPTYAPEPTDDVESEEPEMTEVPSTTSEAVLTTISESYSVTLDETQPTTEAFTTDQSEEVSTEVVETAVDNEIDVRVDVAESVEVLME